MSVITMKNFVTTMIVTFVLLVVIAWICLKVTY